MASFAFHWTWHVDYFGFWSITMDPGSISHLVRKILNLNGPRFENWQDAWGYICPNVYSFEWNLLWSSTLREWKSAPWGKERAESLHQGGGGDKRNRVGIHHSSGMKTNSCKEGSLLAPKNWLVSGIWLKQLWKSLGYSCDLSGCTRLYQYCNAWRQWS
jgi:hypothetical protein